MSTYQTWISSTLLKKGAEAGLTLAQIGQILCRPDDARKPVCAVLSASNPCLRLVAVVVLLSSCCAALLLKKSGFCDHIKLASPSQTGHTTSIEAIRHANATYRKAQTGCLAHNLGGVQNPVEAAAWEPSSHSSGDDDEIALPAIIPASVVVRGSTTSASVRGDAPLTEALFVHSMHTPADDTLPALPRGWQRREQCGKIYYFNPTLGHTQYEPP